MVSFLTKKNNGVSFVTEMKSCKGKSRVVKLGLKYAVNFERLVSLPYVNPTTASTAL